MADVLRAFIAIELPDKARQLLADIQSLLQGSPAGPWVRWVAPEGVHLTLKFLGNISSDQVDSVGAAIQGASAGLTPFVLATGEIGVFPRLAAPRVIWLGLSGPVAALGQIQSNVEQRLVPLGFALEARPFSPHLTLGRVREGAPADALRTLGQTAARTRPPQRVTIPVSAMVLFQSQLTRAGAVYTPLLRIPLGGN